MKYKIGDSPWIASVGRKPVQQVCPVCSGKKVVTLILGSGDSVFLDCQYCGPSYEPPTGFVTEWEMVSEARRFTIAETRTTSSTDGEKTEYVSIDRYVSDEDGLFDTEAEALIACKKKCQQVAEDERTRAEYIKKNQAKSYSWNAGYHLREAKNHEKQAVYHQEKAVLCKAKEKA